MPAKITLTVATDPEQLVTPTAIERAMDETLALLTGQLGPATKMVFTLEFADEEDAREMRRELHVTLDPRPVGVDVTIKSEVYAADVRAVDYAALPRVDVLHASPPCPAFSVANAARGETETDREAEA